MTEINHSLSKGMSAILAILLLAPPIQTPPAGEEEQRGTDWSVWLSLRVSNCLQVAPQPFGVWRPAWLQRLQATRLYYLPQAEVG